MYNDLMEEILVRLPVKSLLRFKSTCKRWRSLIESTSFIEFHGVRHRLDYHNCLVFSRYNNSNYPSMYCCSLSNNNLDFVSTPLFNLGCKPQLYFEVPSPRLFTLGPLNNGVYCIIRYNHNSRISNHVVTLYNPATREYKTTNAPFSRNTNRVHYGFGSISNKAGIVVDYKVVMILQENVGRNIYGFVSFVYSLKRGSWSKIADVVHGTRNSSNNKVVAGLVNEKGFIETPLYLKGVYAEECSQSSQVFLNGSWHWLNGEAFVTHRCDRVFRFDVVDETFGFMDGPPYDPEYNPTYSLFTSNILLIDDRLSIIHLIDGNDFLDVWVMMEYGVSESWTKIYSCKIDFGGELHRFIGLYYSITQQPKYKIQVQRIFLDSYTIGLVVSWDGSRVTKHEFYVNESDVLWNTLGVSTYVETLDSLTLSQE